ncbi:unnamed protein product [Dimorphilus gyrociliatus]|uniref:Uncharacterized protein n=1 Tax=Dimorphilus gyrociliatus TaxID=2664684 RepID=A0A7I8VYI0_9ANNE|nr:unnamed protein product [Dimorphilus gyrociliatus]
MISLTNYKPKMVNYVFPGTLREKERIHESLIDILKYDKKGCDLRRLVTYSIEDLHVWNWVHEFFPYFTICVQKFILNYIMVKLRMEDCILCGSTRSDIDHSLSKCEMSMNRSRKNPARLGRYQWRHDAILEQIAHGITQWFNFDVYADSLRDYKPMEELVFVANGKNRYPDLVVDLGSKYLILELSCCLEANMEWERDYRRGRYTNVESPDGKKIDVFSLEISVIGIFDPSPLKAMLDVMWKHQGRKPIPRVFDLICLQASTAAALASYYIHKERHRQQNNVFEEPLYLSYRSIHYRYLEEINSS